MCDGKTAAHLVLSDDRRLWTSAMLEALQM